VAERKLAHFCDVFCETGVFSVEQSERILRAAQSAGLAPRVHADELTDLGGAAMAARIKARTADHLLYANDDGIRQMAEAGVIAVLLPGTAYFLHLQRYARARDMIAAGVPVALATDFNPGSCMTESMPLILNMACTQMRMLPAEAITAATINAAWAIGEEDRAGSLEPGKQADVLILDAGNHERLCYHFGVNLVETVVKHGARKIRRLYNNSILAGFAGSAADSFALFSRFESKLEQYRGNLERAAVELARDWRTDRLLRRLEAMMIVADRKSMFLLSGTGDLIEPDDGIVAVGSGGPFAMAAARALSRHTQLTARQIAEEAMAVAAGICIYTNTNLTIEEL